MENTVSDEWQLIHKVTGEVRDLVLFEGGRQERWEKVYARSLIDMLDITGDEKTKVVAYLLKVRDYENRVLETVRSVSAATGVSTKTVQRTFSLMQQHNFMHKIRNGLWRFSPHVIVNGKSAVGAAVFRSWQMEERLEN